MCVCLHGAAHISSHAHISHGHAFHGHGEERLVDTPFIALSALAGSVPRPCSTQTARRLARPHRAPTTRPSMRPPRQPCWQWAHGRPACGQRRFRTCITRALISRTPFPASFFPLRTSPLRISLRLISPVPSPVALRPALVSTRPCLPTSISPPQPFNHSANCEACP